MNPDLNLLTEFTYTTTTNHATRALHNIPQIYPFTKEIPPALNLGNLILQLW